MKAAWIRLLGLLLVISIGVYGDGCSSCNLFNKIYEETLVTVQGIAPQVVFTSSNQGQPLIILPTYNRTENRPGLSLLLCSDPYCSTYEDVEPYSMSIPSGYLYSLSATAVAQDYYAVVMAQSSQVLYLICYDLFCDDYYSAPLQSSASTVQVAYNPVGDQVVVAVLHTVSGSGTVTLYSTYSGTYTYQGVITTSFKQTGWSGLNFAGSPAGWSTVLMSAYSYTLTAYFCNVTNCIEGVAAVGYLASNYSSPLDYSVVYSPTDLYVPSMGSDYSGSFPVIAVAYSKKPATVMFCLSQTCDKNITTSIGKSVSSVSIAYGPDNLPVVHYIDNSVLTIAHCQNVLCNSTQPNNGTGYYAPFTNTFKVSTTEIDVLNAVSSPPLTLALVQATDYNSTFYRVPFCGPFIDYMTPTDGSTDEDTTITVYGWSFCKNVTSACKFGNSSVKASVQSSTELTCTINFPNETDVHVMVGTSDWSLYSYVPGSFKFTAPEAHYPNAGKIGFAIITFIMASFFIVAFLTAFIYFRHSHHRKFEAPSSVRKNFYNIAIILSIPTEFVQLLAFSSGIDAEWAHVIHEGSSSFILDFPSVPFVPVFFLVASVTFLWCFYVIPFLIRTDGSLLVNKLQKSGIMRILYTPAYLLLIPMGTCLFFPVINTLLGMVSCEYWNDDYDHAVLAQDHGVACWYKSHIYYSIVAFAMFYIYFPLAIILHPRLQQMSEEVDIKYDEKFLFIQSLLKMILCVVSATFVEFELPKLAMVAATTFLLAIVSTEMRPCNVEKLNSGLSTIYFGAFACAACSVWASFVSSDNIAPLVALLLSWMMLAIFLILSLTGYWRAFWHKKHNAIINTMTRDEKTPLVLS